MTAKTDRGKQCEQDVIREYFHVTARYGSLNRDVSKNRLYRDIAEKLKYSDHRVGVIVRNYIKGKIRLEEI